ncbi:MAG: type II toxin-antitoxin system VapC family toxin, partial [Bacteroidota bacterium]
LVSPVLWRSEFRNILVKYLRQGLMSIQDANAILTSVETRMKGRELHVDSFHVVELALENSCSAYDAEYVVLAKQLSVRLLTEDKEVLKRFPDIAISLQNFVAA